MQRKSLSALTEPGAGMPDHEYRVLAAPDRATKARDKGADPFAQAVQDVLNAEARDGWEFIRAETLPQVERSGLTGTKTGFKTLLVFRRPTGIDDGEATRAALKLLENRADPAP
jgi:hypothetical protein